MITLKEYAKLHNITYEAVRSQVNRYREQLGDHIVQDGRQQFLDDYAVAFLDERRQKNPVVVYQQSKDEAIEDLRKEVEAAYKTIAAQAVMITDLQQFKIATMENTRAIEDTKTAQERRERELDEREGQMAQLVSEAAQKASEDTRKTVEEEKNREIAQIRQEDAEKLAMAEDALRKQSLTMDEMKEEMEQMLLDQVEQVNQIEKKDLQIQQKDEQILAQQQKIQEMENRSRWQRFLDVFK